MKIGIDIDGVLTNYEQFAFDYFSKFCVENDINYNITESDYDTAKTFQVNKEIEKNFLNKYFEFYSREIKPRPFAAEVINKLKTEGHKIYIITARTHTNRNDDLGEKARNTLINWLQENKIYYDKILFCKRPTRNKINEIKDNSIDIMIEDSPKNIIELSNIIPVICFNSEYNKNLSGDNITRCYSWYDVYKVLGERNEKTS